jgi:hypothetical protein
MRFEVPYAETTVFFVRFKITSRMTANVRFGIHKRGKFCHQIVGCIDCPRTVLETRFGDSQSRQQGLPSSLTRLFIVPMGVPQSFAAFSYERPPTPTRTTEFR